MRRLMTEDNRFCIVALDQRAILARMLADLKGVAENELPFKDMLTVKRLLVESFAESASAMLFDPNIAVPAALDILPRHTGLLISLEHHVVEENALGRKSRSIPDWSVEKIQHLGADAVKLLIWYHPDADDSVKRHQENYVREVGRACAHEQLPFVLELLSYQPATLSASTKVKPTLDIPKTSQISETDLPEIVLRSVQEFSKADYGVDLFKLESPVSIALLKQDSSSNQNQQAFNDIGSVCADAEIPWVLLSAGVTTVEFVEILAHAYQAGAHGFLAGRAIWKQPLQYFPDINHVRNSMQDQGGKALDKLIELTSNRATPYSLENSQAWHRFSEIVSEGDFSRMYCDQI